MPGAKRLDPATFEGAFTDWRARVDKMHANTRFTPNPDAAWSPVTKPVSRSRVALVTTAGAHLRSQPAFDLADEHGDASYRLLPGDTDVADLAVSHAHYDTADANADPNVVLPLDALRGLVTDGVVGEASPIHVGMMGWVPDGAVLRDETAPEVARLLVDAEVDACVLTPG